MADLPQHLAEYVAADWGCVCGLPWCGLSHCAGYVQYRTERRKWLDDHNVDVIGELQARVAARSRRRAVAP